MRDAIRLIESSERILLSGHLRADGDCLGAQSVLFHMFRAMGKQVEVMLPNPPDGRYGFLEAHTPWTLYDGNLPEADLLLVCDCNQLDRLGAMGDAVAASAMPRVALDHHPIAVDHGWTALVHDETSAASGLLALDLASAMGYDALPIEAYEAAFVALMTTGMITVTITIITTTMARPPRRQPMHKKGWPWRQRRHFRQRRRPLTVLMPPACWRSWMKIRAWASCLAIPPEPFQTGSESTRGC